MMPKCIICQSESNFLLKKDGYDIYLCSKCDLSFVYPQPDMNFLKNDVYSEKSGYQGNKKSDLSSAKPTLVQSKILQYFDRQKKGKFLDIGCSSGELMYFLKKKDFDVTGIELNPRTANIAKSNGLNVHIGTIETSTLLPESFDYIHMGDLIEHVIDPIKLIQDAHNLLKRGGQLMIVTPNMDCFWSRFTFFMYKVCHIPPSVITPPHHLFQFSIKNLTTLLGRNNLSVHESWFTKTPTLKYELGSMHLLREFKKDKNISRAIFTCFSYAIYTLIFGMNRILELFTRNKFGMTIVATKQ